jgi:hypothetical protein
MHLVSLNVGLNKKRKFIFISKGKERRVMSNLVLHQMHTSLLELTCSIIIAPYLIIVTSELKEETMTPFDLPS